MIHPGRQFAKVLWLLPVIVLPSFGGAGAPADLVLAADTFTAAVMDCPPCTLVVRAGKVVAPRCAAGVTLSSGRSPGVDRSAATGGVTA